MANKFDKYLQRLYSRRIASPEMDTYRNISRSMAPTVKSLEFATKGGIREAGGSIGALSQLGIQSQQALQDAATDRFAIASQEAGKRNAILDQEIDRVTMQRDAERDAGKDNALQTVLRVGGTVAGAAIGSIAAPGAGTMLGAQIGSSLGQIGSGFVGGGGDIGLEYADEAQIAQGIADIAMSITSASMLKEQKEMAKNVGSFISTNMNDEAKIEAMKLAILIGPDAVKQLFNTVGTPAAPEIQLGADINSPGKKIQLGMQQQFEELLAGIANPQPSQQTEPGAVSTPGAVVPDSIAAGSPNNPVPSLPIQYNIKTNDTPSIDPSIEPRREPAAEPTSPTQESQPSAAPQPDPAGSLYYQNGDRRERFSNQAPVGNYRVGQGQLFSRRSSDGALLIKVNGYYKVLRKADSSAIRVRTGQQITVNEDGTISVGGE